MTIEDWRSKPMIFVDDVHRPELADADLHHYRRVRRLADRTPVTISDGLGSWRPALFADAPEPDGPVVVEPEPLSPCTVGFAPVKGDRPELVIQKLTELGVDVIVPLQTARSVVRWDAARAAKNVAKWKLIAREASMQSRRVRLPHIRAVTQLSSILAEAADSVVLAEPGSVPLEPAADRFVLVGPEGGWSEDELRGQRTRALPGGVLRAETAAIAAGVLLATSPPPG